MLLCRANRRRQRHYDDRHGSDRFVHVQSILRLLARSHLHLRPDHRGDAAGIGPDLGDGSAVRGDRARSDHATLGPRYIQSTTLNYNPGNVLGSWAPATLSLGLVSGGDVVGLDGVVLNNYTGPGGGVLAYGDFGLQYVPSLAGGSNSGLVLVSNFGGFLGVPVFDIGNASITATASELQITGNLLLDLTYATYFGGTPGANVGSFSLTAVTAAVPEPSSLSLGLLAFLALLLGAWKCRRWASSLLGGCE